MFGKKIAAILSTVMIITGACVPSVVVHAQTGYAADHTQEASAAGTQSTAKLVASDPAEAMPLTGCIPMEIFRYREKGKLKLPMIFHTDPKR